MRKLFIFMACMLYFGGVIASSPEGEQESWRTEDNVVYLKGKVVDKNGISIIGAYVFVKSTTIAATTDVDGLFELKLPKGEQLSVNITYLGMKPEVYLSKGISEEMTFVLKEDAELLGDVVVIGYGNKKRGSLTSSVESVDRKDLKRMAATTATVDNVLGGTVKGVLVKQSSGEPGSTPVINVRGVTSPYSGQLSSQAGNVPLFVIDGVPTFVEGKTLNPLLAISPNDIESIDVLKDAAATAIYGSRGANGVVIVKTKNGHKGENLSIEAGYSVSIGNPIKKYKPLNRADFIKFQENIVKNTLLAINEGASYTPIDFLKGIANIDLDPNTGEATFKGMNLDSFGKEDTDWVDAVQKNNAVTHNYNFAARGGSEHSSYSFSFNGLNQEGLVINDKFEHYTTRLSLDTDLSESISAGVAISYAYSNRDSGRTGNSLYEEKAWNFRPDAAIYDEKGNFKRIEFISAYGDVSYMSTPVAVMSKESIDKNNQVFGNAYLKINLLEGLDLYTDISLSYNTFGSSYFTPLKAVDLYIDPYTGKSSQKSRLVDSDSDTFTSSINARLDYSFDYEGHSFSAMAGIGRDRTFMSSKMVQYADFLNDESAHNISSAATITSASDSKVKSGLNSLYSRFSYDYDDRYLLELSMRADRSSKFGPGNQWGYFPAISLGWRVVNESFMDKFEKVDELKLRASWGQTGSTNVPDFAYIQQLISGGSNVYGPKLQLHLKDMLPNKDIRWETTSEVNLGADFSFFEHRLYGSIDAYYRFTDGALAPAPHLLSSGLSGYYANIIDVSNRGLEFMIGGDIIRNDDFTWNSSLNISLNRNKIESLNGAIIPGYVEDAFVVGEPSGTIKGYLVKKIVQDKKEIDALNNLARLKEKEIAKKEGRAPRADDEVFYQDRSTGVGDYIYKDLNGDGRITKEHDREILASPEPDFFGGWSNTFRYKKLTLYIMSQFSQGGKAQWNSLRSNLSTSLGYNVIQEAYNDSWTPNNTTAKYPRMVSMPASYYNMEKNDRTVFDNSFFRMKNVTLSYQLTDEVEKFGIQGISLSLGVTNLFTLTDWPGLDPDVGSALLVNASSNEDPYPASRTVSFGVKVQF